MKPLGGTEILYNGFLKHVGNYWQENTNIILSTCDPRLVDQSKRNILWQHISYDQRNAQMMNDIEFVNMINQFVYVSNWQLNQYQQRFPIHSCNNVVLKNAIEPIEYIEKPTDKIRLIYTSMPFRGLDVLLDAFDLINNGDVELVVYSSNVIYGTNYSNAVGNSYDQLFNRCKSTPNVIYKGYAMNKAVKKAVQSAHILAYPSTFEETSCLAAIEAGAAGCKIVTTELGALPETCNNWATYVPFTNNRTELVHNYAETLKKAIDNYSSSCYNIQAQSHWFNEQYSWLNRATEWHQLLRGEDANSI